MLNFKQFTAPLDYRYDAEASAVLGKDHWRVLRGFRYYIGEMGSREWVDIEAGELSDRASVPRLLHSLVPPDGVHGQAAVVHDKLCRTLAIMRNGEPVMITRARADVSAYRLITFTSKPQEDKRRIRLEREWRRDNGVGG
jgi:hypothetical protein